MNRSPFALAALFSAVQATQGCDRFPDEAELFDEAVVATVYDQQADFRSYETFSIASVVRTADLTEDDGQTDGTLDAESAGELIARVTLLVQERGYLLVDPMQTPDLGVSIAVVRGTASRAVTGGYWGGYYGGYWGYPGAGYYYPFAYSYTYSTGSVVVDMVDLKRARAQRSVADSSDAGSAMGARGLAVVWGAIAYKALPVQTVGAGDVSRALEQAFLQSPYLRR